MPAVTLAARLVAVSTAVLLGIPAGLGGAAALPTAPASARGLTWKNVTTGVSPPPLDGASMVYDAARGFVPLFGGYSSASGNYSNGTWTYTIAGGRLLNLAVAPPPRVGASMVYDAKDGNVVLFGGYGNYTTPLYAQPRYDDTWTFAHGHWTQLFLAKRPAQRCYASMAYDTRTGATILYGGWATIGFGGTFDSDTWSFSGGNWTVVTTRPNPMPLTEAGAAAYDARNHAVIFAGGTSRYTGRIGSRLRTG